MITISHSHSDGTTLDGSTPGDGVLELVALHGFIYRRYAGIHVPHTRDTFSDTHRITAAAESLRAAGFTVTITIDDQWRPAAVREADRADRAAIRTDRLSERATTAEARADATRERADQLTAGRPGGQPILIGHHSENKARRDQERSDKLRFTAIDESAYAARLGRRADGARDNETAKHQPRAIANRIEELSAGIWRWERARDNPQSSDEFRRRAQLHIDRDSEDRAHQRTKLAAMAQTGQFVLWTRDDFRIGDHVRVSGYGWHRVTRVNAKSVSVAEGGYLPTVAYRHIHGRRRDGQQLDTPAGIPWPVKHAQRVGQWVDLRAQTRHVPTDSATRHKRSCVQAAQRIAHGLDLDAADAEVTAFAQQVTDVDKCRELAMFYLDIYQHLFDGTPQAVVRAGVTPLDIIPAWRLPAHDPAERRASELRPGDLVKGLWDSSSSGRYLWRHFAGPVADVSPAQSRPTGSWVSVTLVDGTTREDKTYARYAVYPAGTWEATAPV
ncbi:DUF3560 domain-containing protein [Micromonospora sp. NPDC051141]|uniref:DUF3560 domain-containing protein n=1 Tax=Micromonospora sp. NPDC051141 TaxID=3364284 RepID=UPI00378CB4B1